MVRKIKKYESISPTLQDLPWLPVCKRIKFKILLLTFKAIHGLAPIYLQDMVKIHVPERNTRTGKQRELVRTSPRLKSYGERAFAYSSHHLWNNLPVDVRLIDNIEHFKKVIKTLLFKQSY